MKSFILLVVASLCLCCISARKLPKLYDVCKKSAPDFDECVAKAIAKAIKELSSSGDKELGIKMLEPLVASEIHIPGNGGKVDLEQTYHEMEIHGLSNTQVNKFKLTLNDKECKMHMETLMPTISLTGTYKIVGKLLIFTLNGFGKNNITITNLKALHELDCEKTTKKGKEYLNIIKYHVDLQPEAIHYDFENLVDGNAELSAQVSQVVNDNALDVFSEIKDDYGRTFGEIFRQIANLLFNKVPINDIFVE